MGATVDTPRLLKADTQAVYIFFLTEWSSEDFPTLRSQVVGGITKIGDYAFGLSLQSGAEDGRTTAALLTDVKSAVEETIGLETR